MLALLLTLLAGAVTVELPAGEPDEAWERPARLAGVRLGAASSGPRAVLRSGGRRWTATVIDADGRRTRFELDPPASAAAREDLLNTLASLAEPADARERSRPALTLPPVDGPADEVASPAPASTEAGPAELRPPRAPDRPRPPPSEPPVPQPEPARVEAPSPAPVGPIPPAPAPATPSVDERRLDPDLAPGERGGRVPAESLRWQLALTAGAGADLRADAGPALVAEAGLTAERGRVGLHLRAGSTVPRRERDVHEDRLRWMRLHAGGGVHRAGPGLQVGVSGWASGRRFTSASRSAWVAVPTARVEGGWRSPIGVRSSMAARAWLATDLGSTTVVSARERTVLLDRVSGGIILEFSQKVARR